MARIGLRMMPPFPSSPLRFRTVSFPAVRLQGRYIGPGLPADCELVASDGWLPSFVHLDADIVPPR
jgi:hypothetical protein